ncbi:MAG: hypothetical protein HY820_29455 [Acidobacteria bacterium]|nr:hypothetical protein [Acidobacteriota bacterium]
MNPILPMTGMPLADTSRQSVRTPSEAAQQFESLILGQLLKSARESSSVDGKASNRDAVFEMAENHFAQVLAAHGGLGLSSIIAAGLTRASESATSPDNVPAARTNEVFDLKPTRLP